MKIHYEPHPVSPERKAELRAMGVKIVDARFAPQGQPQMASMAVTRGDIAAMTKRDVVDLLEEHGADTSGKVAELRERAISVMFVNI